VSQSANNQGLTDVAVIHGGPLFNWLNKLGMSFVHGSTKKLCAGAVLGTWVVMAVLAAMQGIFINSSLRIPYGFDIAEMVRFGVVVPLLIGAEPMVEPWLKNVLDQFRTLVPEQELPDFEAHLQTARRQRDLWYVEALIFAFAILRPHFDPTLNGMHDVTTWQMINGQTSWAELYSDFIAKPIVGIVFLRWLWKYIVWSLLLCRISTLNLKLIPSHPDDVGGLGFVSIGQTKFSILVVAMAAMVAANGADQILFEQVHFLSMRWLILAVVILAMMIFATPLFAFTPKLIECKRRGLFTYGKLAQEYVNSFEEKWIEKRQDTKDEILGHADIATLADLENAFNIVQRMSIVLINRSFLTTFALSAVLPFAPLLLTMVSVDQLMDRVFKNFI